MTAVQDQIAALRREAEQARVNYARAAAQLESAQLRLDAATAALKELGFATPEEAIAKATELEEQAGTSLNLAREALALTRRQT